MHLGVGAWIMFFLGSSIKLNNAVCFYLAWWHGLPSEEKHRRTELVLLENLRTWFETTSRWRFLPGDVTAFAQGHHQHPRCTRSQKTYAAGALGCAAASTASAGSARGVAHTHGHLQHGSHFGCA